MSESMHDPEVARIEAALARLTPLVSLNRDALLFAAGRASARPSRGWMALTGVLAAAQLLTVVLLWPSPAPPTAVPRVATHPPAVETPAPPLAATAALALRRHAVETEGDLPCLAAVEPMVCTAPPLRAFAVPQALLE